MSFVVPYTFSFAPTGSTSGTTSYNPALDDIVLEAYDRIGIRTLSGQDYRTARRSIDLMMMDWASRGLNLWKITQGTQVLTPGTATYQLTWDVVDLIETMLRTTSGTQTLDYSLNRLSVSTYAVIPNKTITGRPVSIYVDRQEVPQYTLWPVPDAVTTYTLVYWQLGRIQDTGSPASNTMDVPWRFLPALCAGLAYHLGMKRPDVVDPNRLSALKSAYDEAWLNAAGEDRSRASFRFVPYIQRIGA